MTDIDDRFARLERDLAEVKDVLAIYQQTAAYGPAVDAGDHEAAADLFAEDGLYDWGRGMAAGSVSSAEGCEALKKIFDGPEHRALINGGAAHWLTLPQVVVGGDYARSLCYSALLLRTAEGHAVARVSACFFEWRRFPDGWKIHRRRNRLLDGSDDARSLFAEGLGGPAGRYPSMETDDTF